VVILIAIVGIWIFLFETDENENLNLNITENLTYSTNKQYESTTILTTVVTQNTQKETGIY